MTESLTENIQSLVVIISLLLLHQQLTVEAKESSAQTIMGAFYM